MNDLLVKACLAVLLVGSAEASELVSTDGDGCSRDTFVKAPRAGRPAGEKLYSGRKVSLDFKDADIVNVLRMLSEVGSENIVVTDDVKGRITVRLIDVPWDQAFDVVLQMSRLRCVQVGSSPRVSAITGLERE